MSKTNTKEKIISSAIDVFAEKGKHGATMDEIASKAGINKAMVYYYYSTKEHLFNEVVITIMNKCFAQLTENLKILETTKDPIEKIKLFIIAHTNSLSENPKYSKIILDSLASCTGSCISHNEIKKHKERPPFTKILLDILEEGIDKKIFRNVDTKQIIISIIGMDLIYFIAKPIAHSILEINTESDKTFMRKRRDSIIDLLLYGIVERRKS